jgi:hypothetical protein
MDDIHAQRMDIEHQLDWCLISIVLGRLPLMPLFLHSNATQTISYELQKFQRNQFPYCRTDTAKKSGRRGSNVCELNAGCGSLGADSLLWGVYLSLIQRICE